MPPALARWFTEQGHDAEHVFDVGDENVQPLDAKLLSEKSSAFYYSWNYTVATFETWGGCSGGLLVGTRRSTS